MTQAIGTKTVIVSKLQYFPGVTEHDDIVGVINVTTPTGDTINLALTPHQVDEAATKMLELACDLLTVE